MKIFATVLLGTAVLSAQVPLGSLGRQPILHAHNCYPYDGQWADRIDRALGTGLPVTIEQDLAWYASPATSEGHLVLSHVRETKGSEPSPRTYFFERIRPVVEKALSENDRSRWPLIILHLDFKENREEVHRALWDLLGEYETWITTAPKRSNPGDLAPFDVKPLLVLTEDNDAQEEVFFKRLPIGAKLRVFGSAHTNRIPGSNDEERLHASATMTPKQLLSERPTNYRRWWNNSWALVEEGGQNRAGSWTAADDARLRALVNHGHKMGFWVRFFNLNGYTPADDRGWDKNYNFGSKEAVLPRWTAAMEAGVDLIATDQFEDLAAVLARRKPAR